MFNRSEKLKYMGEINFEGLKEYIGKSIGIVSWPWFIEGCLNGISNSLLTFWRENNPVKVYNDMCKICYEIGEFQLGIGFRNNNFNNPFSEYPILITENKIYKIKI